MRSSYGEAAEFVLLWAWVYVGTWLLFCEPLYQFCLACKTGTLTISIVIFTIIKIAVSLAGWNTISKDLKRQSEEY